ncbi:hypothetical protein ACI2L1_12080 [Streptomyces sp. NPDC019531]|uniref:hypothetical protein n=1 Tax=Streptomyces sp. NPDC019531 TaxID=3365062 RepID=UPI00384DA56F
MTDHVAGPNTPASSRLAELHQLCDQDFTKGQAEQASAQPFPPYTPFATAFAIPPAPEPSDLAVAIRVARKMLAAYGDSSADGFDYPAAYGAVSEALRILVRAVDGEKGCTLTGTPGGDQQRCPAAHPEDPDPCVGLVVVTVLDRENAGADGCEHHAARMLASLDGARVYALPDAPDGAAIRAFKAADSLRPFPWVDGPRTRPEQLSRAETRERGEGQ